MIVATRMLKIQSGERELAVPVVIHAPVEADRCWECQFEIGWPEGQQRRTVRGLDGVQALHLAMQGVAFELYGSEYHQRKLLRWTNVGEGYGFPMAKAGYADLIGDDRIAQV